MPTAVIPPWGTPAESDYEYCHRCGTRTKREVVLAGHDGRDGHLLVKIIRRCPYRGWRDAARDFFGWRNAHTDRKCREATPRPAAAPQPPRERG